MDILSDHYWRHFNAWEAYGQIYETLERRRNEKRFYIFKTLCRHKGRIIENKENRFGCVIESRKNNTLLEELNKNSFIKQKKISEPLNLKYDDEILVAIIVYR